MKRLVEPVTLRPLALGPLAVAGLFGWLGLRSGNPWLQFLACAGGAPLVVAWVLRPPLDGLAVAWRGPFRATVGELVEHRFEAQNRGRRTTPQARVVHVARGWDDLTLSVPALPPGGTAEIVVRRRPTLRAAGDRHTVAVTSAAPLGLVEHRRTWTLSSPYVVHPAPAPPATDLGRGGDGEAASASPARTGVDLHATREWRPGDDRRHVHWRSTARHGRLVVVEPERPIARRLAVVLADDARHPRWELLVSRAAATVVEALREGREVLLLATEDDGEVRRLVTSDLVAALDWFAALRFPRAAASDLLAEAAGWAGPGSQVLLATTADGVPPLSLSSSGAAPGDTGGRRGGPALVVLRPDGVEAVVR